MTVLVQGGRVYDPVNGVDGEVRDIAVRDGKIVPVEPEPAPERVIDASGYVVLPGAVDVHSHVAGPCVNRARRLMAGHAPAASGSTVVRPESTAPVPSTVRTGQLYAGLGYTTVVEAAVSPAGARQCHLELADVPCVDKGFLLLLSGHELILGLLRKGEQAAARRVVGALLARTGAFGVKVVNPGGGPALEAMGMVPGALSEPSARHGISPRALLEFFAAAAEDLDLPHPVHIHANHLGIPGNIETTLETSRILCGRRHHLAHAQFHCYGDDGRGGYASAARVLAEYVHNHDDVSLDVGPVMFGDTVTISADTQLEHALWQLTGERYVSIGSELESGCGILPFRYSESQEVHALQWAAGIELLLLVEDPWRLALSADHPNAASFLSFPAMVALLMDADLRREKLQSLDFPETSGCVLPELTREYTLREIAIITRAAPARILGLSNKGHLGVGADADIAIYSESEDRERMFRYPAYVIQGGSVVVDRGGLERSVPGRMFRVSPPGQYKEKELRRWVEQFGSFRLEQLGPDARSLLDIPVVRREKREVSSS